MSLDQGYIFYQDTDVSPFTNLEADLISPCFCFLTFILFKKKIPLKIKKPCISPTQKKIIFSKIFTIGCPRGE